MPNALLDAALAYARRGFPIFPCRADKTPYIAGGVLKATTDPAQITQWWQTWPAANIAVDVGAAGMMVVEIDSYKPEFKPEAVAALNLPETLLRQRSPRGGEHLFYALQPGELVAMSASKLAPCVDVRSFHSYVLLAPSRTADGSYEWVSEGKPAFRTDAMVALANTARAKSEDHDTWTIEPDLPENVAAATKWLREDARIAVEGVDGDATAYATAAHLKSFGISEALALDLMWEHWNPRCSPPWSADQIDHFERKVQNGYRYNTSPPGNITEAYRVARQSELFKPVALPPLPSGRQAGRGRFRFIDREGIDHLAPPSWLLADLLPVGGYGVLVGTWGSFKTFLALDMALTVATGFPVNPTCVPLQFGPVLFIAGEGRSGVGPRIRAWEKLHAGAQKSPNFVLADPVPNIKEDWAPFIAGAKGMFPTYKLVVIDTIGRAMQGANENSQEFASLFTNRVQELQQELDCAVLAVHHLGKDGERGARGSSVFGADADMMLQASQLDPLTAEVTMLKQKDAAAWEHPQTRKMIEVDLGAGLKSLVVMPGEPRAPKTEKSRELFQAQAVHASLDKAIMDELATNKMKGWSTAALAQSLACRPDIEIDSATLQAKVLRRLREGNGTLAARCYDRHTRRWRYPA